MPNLSKPRTVALIVTYQRPELLRGTIEAVLGQEYPPSSVVVVNNGQDAETRQVLDDFPLLDIVQSVHNMGPAGAFDVGIHRAMSYQPLWIWLLQDDLLPYPNALAQLVAHGTALLDRKPGLVGCWIRGIDGAARNCGALWRGRKVNNIPLPPESGPDYRVDLQAFQGSLLSHSAVKSAGTPRADYFIMLEELEYCLRLQEAGFTHWIIPQVLIEDPVPMPTVYPPSRGYYQARNGLRTLVDRRRPGEICWFLFDQTKRMCAATRLERPWERIRLRGRGLWDGIRGVSGPTVNLVATNSRTRQGQDWTGSVLGPRLGALFGGGGDDSARARIDR